MAAKRKNTTHSEVLSGATFKPAHSEKAATIAAQVHRGSGHRVKVAQHGKKWGCWVWPKGKNPGMNSDSGGTDGKGCGDNSMNQNPRRRRNNSTGDVSSPTRTATEVRSPTRTATEVRSPTKTSTSTDAYTAGNVTVTGGAGAGATTSVHIHQKKQPEDPKGSSRGKGMPESVAAELAKRVNPSWRKTMKAAKKREAASRAKWGTDYGGIASETVRRAKTATRIARRMEKAGRKIKARGDKFGDTASIFNPKGKRNPASAAVAMRENFTGLPSKEYVDVPDRQHVHSHLAALGELIELKVKTVKGEIMEIEFEQPNPKKDALSKVSSKVKGWVDRRGKALTGTVKYLTDYWINPRKMNPNGPVLLCSNEKGTHLFIEGGDQSLDLGKLGLSELKEKESIIVGSVKTITYHARKKFDSKVEEYDYIHKFSEDSDGPLPMLRYDVKNKHLYLDGGVYHIPKPLLGTSQGITD